MIGKKLSLYIDSLFDQSSNPVHSIAFPLTFVLASFRPPVVSETFPFVSVEVSLVCIPSCPTIVAKAMLCSEIELSFILLSNIEGQSSWPLLEIILPKPLIYISVFIVVETLVAKVVSECSLENISIE